MSTIEKIVTRGMERDIVKSIRDGKYVQASEQLKTLISYTQE